MRQARVRWGRGAREAAGALSGSAGRAGGGALILEEPQLSRDLGAAEGGGGEGADAAVEGVLAGEDVEGPGELLGEGAAASAALGGGGVVELAAAELAEEGFDLAGAVRGDVAPQPVEEEVLELVGEAEEDPAGAAGAGGGDTTVHVF